MNTDLNDLLRIAKSIELPDWATHVAVSRVRDSDAEPCVWLEEAGDYVDENPENLKNHVWTGSYKHAYWHFFSREELTDAHMVDHMAITNDLAGMVL